VRCVCAVGRRQEWRLGISARRHRAGRVGCHLQLRNLHCPRELLLNSGGGGGHSFPLLLLFLLPGMQFWACPAVVAARCPSNNKEKLKRKKVQYVETIGATSPNRTTSNHRVQITGQRVGPHQMPQCSTTGERNRRNGMSEPQRPGRWWWGVEGSVHVRGLCGVRAVRDSA